VDDVFVHARATGATSRVSVGPGGAEADDASIDPRLTDDGSQVAFASLATNLVAGDTNAVLDVFVHDRLSAVTTRVSVTANGGQRTGEAWEPAVSADGRWVAFHGEEPGQACLSAYVRDRFGLSPTIATFCTVTPTGMGCLPSISGAGVPSASAGSGFTVAVDALPGQTVGIVFYGVSGPQSTPFGAGSGVLCVRNPLQRTGLMPAGGTAGACDGRIAVDWNQFVAVQPAVVGTPFLGGETVWAQAWFRDVLAPGGTTLSNGLWFTVCP
jgi:hypothetical protein